MNKDYTYTSGELSEVSTMNKTTNQSFIKRQKPRSLNIADQRAVFIDHRHSYYHEQFEQPASPWRQSAATWRATSPTCSFSKQKRFATEKFACNYKLSFNIPSSLTQQNATTQGFGRKSEFYRRIVRQTKDLMAKDNILIDQIPKLWESKRGRCRKYIEQLGKQCHSQKQRKCGKSFGYSFEKYKKNGILGIDFINPSKQSNPGVGSYSVTSSKKNQGYQIYQRLTPCNELFDHYVPALTIYSPSFKQVWSSRYESPWQGLSNRLDLAKPLNNNPGPDAYSIKRYQDK